MTQKLYPVKSKNRCPICGGREWWCYSAEPEGLFLVDDFHDIPKTSSPNDPICIVDDTSTIPFYWNRGEEAPSDFMLYISSLDVCTSCGIAFQPSSCLPRKDTK